MAGFRHKISRAPDLDSERDGEAMVGLYAPESLTPSSDALQAQAEAIPDLELFYHLENIFAVIAGEGQHHLAKAMGNASLILGNSPDDGRSRNWAHQVVESIDQYEKQLAWLQWYRTKGMSRRRPVAWTAFLDEVVDEFTRFNQQNIPIRIVNHVSGGGNFHADLLKRVLLHVIRNAYEAVNDQGSIVVSSTVSAVADSDDHTRVTVRVRDDGPGISADKTAEVWRPFFSSRINHFGLGLNYVQMAVATIGGEVDIESMAGCGTTVTITLETEGDNFASTQTTAR